MEYNDLAYLGLLPLLPCRCSRCTLIGLVLSLTLPLSSAFLLLALALSGSCQLLFLLRTSLSRLLLFVIELGLCCGEAVGEEQAARSVPHVCQY